NSIYMDDALLWAESIPALQELLSRVSKVMSEASFELHKIVATPEVAQALNLEVSKEVASVLGVKWHLASDSIVFRDTSFCDASATFPPTLVHLSTSQVEFTRRGLASYF